MESQTHDSEDSIVCYCYKLTTRQLKESYRRHRSLRVLQDETRAGMGCGGCRVILHSLFDEEPTEINETDVPPALGTSCLKPGSRIMKGFIISDGNLESTVYSSNAIAPQLGDCDSTSRIHFALLDHRGAPIIVKEQTVLTNETFIFETSGLDLPRPFYGMFVYALDRSNFGATRFNIYRSNAKSTTSTQENSSTGRLRVFVPIIADRQFMKGPNRVYLAIMNPHNQPARFRVSAFDVETLDSIEWISELPAHGSTWVDANASFYAPALSAFPGGRLALRLVAGSRDIRTSLTVYFFVHNQKLDTWTSNHL